MRWPPKTLTFTISAEYQQTKDYCDVLDCPVAASLKDLGYEVSVGVSFFGIYYPWWVVWRWARHYPLPKEVAARVCRANLGLISAEPITLTVTAED